MDTSGSTTCPRRSKTGCQQCRQRRRKCDEQHPSCEACVTRGLDCSWQRPEPARQRVARRSQNQNRDFALPQEMRPLLTVFTAPPESVQHNILSYFRENSPLWITAGGHAKSGICLESIIPAAIRSPLVLHCVLAIAAGDMGKYQPASSGMTCLTQGFYGQAVAGLHSAINYELCQNGLGVEPAHTGDDTLLAVILLCVHEAVNFSDTERIIPHLNAAAILCYNRRSDPPSTCYLRGLLFEVFCYLFTLTAFAHGSRMHLRLAHHVFQSPLLSEGYCQGALLGNRCRKVISVILGICMLTADSSVVGERRMSELRAFEAQLQGSAPSENGTDASSDEELTAELYRLACLVHIKKTISPQILDESDTIQGILARFMTTLNHLPPDSPTNNILCWPLVVAGLASVSVIDRRLIAGRLRKNHETWRSDILTQSVKILSDKWKEDASSEPAASFRKSNGWQVSAFPIPFL